MLAPHATPTAAGPLGFGRVPHPPCAWRILTAARKPSGWSRLGPRRIVGTCVHRMEGTLRGTEAHFLSDDPHGRDALTDYCIGGALDGERDGAIWAWLGLEDDRAPWANGPADDLEGGGPAFVRAFGVAAVNRDLKSIELSGHARTPVTPRQFEALCRLIAHWHDRAGVPWHAFPLHPASGVVTQMQHWEFGPKDCPFVVVRGLTNAYQDRVRAILEAAQTGRPVPGPSVPPPAPVAPRLPFARGQDAELAAWQFGGCERVLAGGSPELDPATGQPRRYVFDANGVVSNAWLERGNAEDAFPRIAEWRQRRGADGRLGEAIRFENGWTLFNPAPGAGWHWLGRDGPEASARRPGRRRRWTSPSGC